jgi:hypothetical protein
MSIFATTDRVSLDIPIRKNKTQGVTLLIRDDLSVEQAMAYQDRSEKHEGNNYELGIALLLAYVDGWEVDGADSGAPWEEATLRKVNLKTFEALVVAITEKLDPEPDALIDGDDEDASPNA